MNYEALGLTEEQVKQVLTTWEHLAKMGWKAPRVGMALLKERDELRAQVEKFQEQERKEAERCSRSCSDCSKFNRSQSCPGCEHCFEMQNEFFFDFNVATRCEHFDRRTKES